VSIVSFASIAAKRRSTSILLFLTITADSCYDCCAKRDIAEMTATGRIVLYLTGIGSDETVSNWPGTLCFPVTLRRISRHNIAGKRADVWFTGPNGKRWWGWNCGDNQILRCRRLKAA